MTLNHRRRVRKWTRAEKITRCVPRVRSLINHSSEKETTIARQHPRTYSRRDEATDLFLLCLSRLSASRFAPFQLCKSPIVTAAIRSSSIADDRAACFKLFVAFLLSKMNIAYRYLNVNLSFDANLFSTFSLSNALLSFCVFQLFFHFPRASRLLSDRAFESLYSRFLDHIRVFRSSYLACARKKGLPKYTEYPRAHRRPASGWLFREYNHETKRLAVPAGERGSRGASRGTRKKREDEKEIERNALLRRGRRGNSLLYTGTFCVSTVLSRYWLSFFVVACFHSSSESWLVIGHTKFVIHGGPLRSTCSRLILPVFDHKVIDELRAMVHFRDRYFMMMSVEVLLMIYFFFFFSLLSSCHKERLIAHRCSVKYW